MMPRDLQLPGEPPTHPSRMLAVPFLSQALEKGKGRNPYPERMAESSPVSPDRHRRRSIAHAHDT